VTTSASRRSSSTTRDHVETFIADTLQRWKPTTAAVRYRSPQQLFKWLTEEGEVPADPTVRMKLPAVPEVPVPAVTDDDLTKLLKACEGATFENDATWPCCAPSSRAAAASVRSQG
jgi:site-specific recombinase XerD